MMIEQNETDESSNADLSRSTQQLMQRYLHNKFKVPERPKPFLYDVDDAPATMFAIEVNERPLNANPYTNRKTIDSPIVKATMPPLQQGNSGFNSKDTEIPRPVSSYFRNRSKLSSQFQQKILHSTPNKAKLALFEPNISTISRNNTNNRTTRNSLFRKSENIQSPLCAVAPHPKKISYSQPNKTQSVVDESSSKHKKKISSSQPYKTQSVVDESSSKPKETNNDAESMLISLSSKKYSINKSRPKHSQNPTNDDMIISPTSQSGLHIKNLNIYHSQNMNNNYNNYDVANTAISKENKSPETVKSVTTVVNRPANVTNNRNSIITEDESPIRTFGAKEYNYGAVHDRHVESETEYSENAEVPQITQKKKKKILKTRQQKENLELSKDRTTRDYYNKHKRKRSVSRSRSRKTTTIIKKTRIYYVTHSHLSNSLEKHYRRIKSLSNRDYIKMVLTDKDLGNLPITEENLKKFNSNQTKDVHNATCSSICSIATNLENEQFKTQGQSNKRKKQLRLSSSSEIDKFIDHVQSNKINCTVNMNALIENFEKSISMDFENTNTNENIRMSGLSPRKGSSPTKTSSTTLPKHHNQSVLENDMISSISNESLATQSSDIRPGGKQRKLVKQIGSTSSESETDIFEKLRKSHNSNGKIAQTSHNTKSGTDKNYLRKKQSKTYSRLICEDEASSSGSSESLNSAHHDLRSSDKNKTQNVFPTQTTSQDVETERPDVFTQSAANYYNSYAKIQQTSKVSMESKRVPEAKSPKHSSEQDKTKKSRKKPSPINLSKANSSRNKQINCQLEALDQDTQGLFAGGHENTVRNENISFNDKLENQQCVPDGKSPIQHSPKQDKTKKSRKKPSPQNNEINLSKPNSSRNKQINCQLEALDQDTQGLFSGGHENTVRNKNISLVDELENQLYDIHYGTNSHEDGISTSGQDQINLALESAFADPISKKQSVEIRRVDQEHEKGKQGKSIRNKNHINYETLNDIVEDHEYMESQNDVITNPVAGPAREPVKEMKDIGIQAGKAKKPKKKVRTRNYTPLNYLNYLKEVAASINNQRDSNDLSYHGNTSKNAEQTTTLRRSTRKRTPRAIPVLDGINKTIDKTYTGQVYYTDIQHLIDYFEENLTERNKKQKYASNFSRLVEESSPSMSEDELLLTESETTEKNRNNEIEIEPPTSFEIHSPLNVLNIEDDVLNESVTEDVEQNDNIEKEPPIDCQVVSDLNLTNNQERHKSKKKFADENVMPPKQTKLRGRSKLNSERILTNKRYNTRNGDKLNKK